MWSKYPRRDFRPGYMFRFLPFSGYAFYAKLRVLVHYEQPKTRMYKTFFFSGLQWVAGAGDGIHGAAARAEREP